MGGGGAGGETCLRVIASKSSARADTGLVWDHPSALRSQLSPLHFLQSNQQRTANKFQLIIYREPVSPDWLMNASYTQQSAPNVTFDRNPDLEYESLSVMNTAESEIRRLHPHKPCSESSLCILKLCIDSLNSQAHIQTRKIRLNICEYSAFREPLGCSVPRLECIGFCVYLFIYLEKRLTKL